MAAKVKENLGRLKDFQRALIQAPPHTATIIMKRWATYLTEQTQQAHTNRRSVYGEARENSVMNGKPLSLSDTGKTEEALHFKLTYTARGAIIKCVLGTPYARYLIRYGLLPNSNATIPVEWERGMRNIVLNTWGHDLRLNK